MGAQEQRCELCGAALPPPTGKRGRPRDYCDPDLTGRPCSMLQRQIAHVRILADRVLLNSEGITPKAWRARALRIGQTIQAIGGDIAYQTAPPELYDPRQIELPGMERPAPPPQEDDAGPR